MSVKDAVAQRFLDICKERNMKINELAERSGVTPSTAYSMVDRSRRNISITTIKKFCDGLDMSLGEFFLLLYLIIWIRKFFDMVFLE